MAVNPTERSSEKKSGQAQVHLLLEKVSLTWGDWRFFGG